jgi:hypothetical protein
MENLMNLLTDAKLLTGVAALIALTVLFLLVVSSGKRRRAKMLKVAPEAPVVIEQAKPELSAEHLVHELLSDRKWRALPFATLAQHIGGYQDDELRKLLVRAGAIRFTTRNGEEQWGLFERNRKHIGHRGDARVVNGGDGADAALNIDQARHTAKATAKATARVAGDLVTRIKTLTAKLKPTARDVDRSQGDQPAIPPMPDLANSTPEPDKSEPEPAKPDLQPAADKPDVPPGQAKGDPAPPVAGDPDALNALGATGTDKANPGGDPPPILDLKPLRNDKKS